jgi:hypothetical protein
MSGRTNVLRVTDVGRANDDVAGSSEGISKARGCDWLRRHKLIKRLDTARRKRNCRRAPAKQTENARVVGQFDSVSNDVQRLREKHLGGTSQI